MRLIFISDLHLSPDRPEANQKFYQLLQLWQPNCDGLYILGDFFDYWLGDDDDNQFIRDMRNQLANFSQLVPLYFRGGNHDFGVGRKFAGQCGMQLIPDLHTLKIGSNVILLSHGDTFCTLDVGYQKMKKILQNPLSKFLLKQIPLKWRYRLKEMLENKSQNQSSNKPQHIFQVVDSSILKLAQPRQANIVIHGHTHHPGRYLITTQDGQNIIRYEIPDWYDHTPGGYILLEDEQINIILT